MQNVRELLNQCCNEIKLAELKISSAVKKTKIVYLNLIHLERYSSGEMIKVERTKTLKLVKTVASTLVKDLRPAVAVFKDKGIEI